MFGLRCSLCASVDLPLAMNWGEWLYHLASYFASGMLIKPHSSMSGVTDMVGYRQTLNLSYHSLDYDSNDTQESCDAEDDVKTSAILVRSVKSVQRNLTPLGGVSSFQGV